ncbi:MAG TPA: SGNH/GDSL hydrolase family protein, partial [Vicinamibacteria bacterium]|nr:SGNH/GDSL hydrolase family protein [Vicinamibacteria bacterium]
SFTWGASVLFDDTYVRRVERGLTARGEDWEAVNLAEPGHNTVLEAARLASEGFAYSPDVVVLGYVLNDSEDENAAEARRAADWLADRRQPPGGGHGLLERSALYRLVRGRVRATLENRRRIDGFLSMYAPDYPGWVAAQTALKAMGGMCRERGVPFVVVVFPLFGNPLDAGYPFADVHARVSRVAAEAGARVVDLLPYYRGLRWELLVVDGADDEHPNEIAHRIAAQALLKALDDVVPRIPR